MSPLMPPSSPCIINMLDSYDNSGTSRALSGYSNLVALSGDLALGGNPNSMQFINADQSLVDLCELWPWNTSDKIYSSITCDSPECVPPKHLLVQDNGEAPNAEEEARRSKKEQGKHHSAEDDSTSFDHNYSRDSAPKPSRKQLQLHSASRASKNRKTDKTPKPAASPEETKARALHDRVEKQYRNRLSMGFENLLSVLTASDIEGGCGASNEVAAQGEDGKAPTKVSRGKVLEMAQKRIKALEKENNTLEKTRDGFLTALEQYEHF